MAGSFLFLDKLSKAFDGVKPSGDFEINDDDVESLEFVEAQIEDGYAKELKKMYKPLNSKPNSNQSTIERYNSSLKVEESELPLPKYNIFNRSLLTHEWKTLRKLGPGFNNLNNTCFMNSVLQILSYTPPLWQYLVDNCAESFSKCKASGFCAQCTLSELFKEMKLSDSPRCPTHFAQHVRQIGGHLQIGHQEDAHEFLISLLDSLKKHYRVDEKRLDRYTRETHLANHIFGGWSRGCVKCLECGHESITYDPLLEINLEIEGCNDIYTSLEHFCSPDKITGKQYNCVQCKRKVMACKSVFIQKHPRFLILHLKRFTFHKGKFTKNSKHVNFPEKLDLTPYIFKPKTNVTYSLYGVIVHLGSGTNFGHYIAYAKNSLGIWAKHNDSNVSPVGMNRVLGECAYLLFYAFDKYKTNGSDGLDLMDLESALNTSSKSNGSVKKSQTMPLSSNYKIELSDKNNDPWSKSSSYSNCYNPPKKSHKVNKSKSKSLIESVSFSGPSLISLGSSVKSWDKNVNTIDRFTPKPSLRPKSTSEIDEADRGKKRKNSKRKKFQNYVFRPNPFQHYQHKIIQQHRN